ncbi:Peptidyl-tRNA hydrolase [Candida viswanathii]|uniref:Peptidyl-tRNA hydrolase n=1 Tax=Candida viswanathii TaxID=5486 RepID=A0A367YCB3_9ASCO|nr:Peptidyl-tRNA hydrolase [Candida viswanathii]
MLRGLLRPFLSFSLESTAKLPKRCLFIASIGNPEPAYKGTRHNAGHRLMNQLIEIYWKDHVYKEGPYYLSLKYPNLVLFKSNDSLMNLQGRAIQKHLTPTNRENMIVLHDELQRDLGKFQIRNPGTMSRGHNGLRSLDKCMGQKYRKLGIGIGRPSNSSVVDYVMGKFTPEDAEILDFEVFPKCVAALEKLIDEDLQQLKDVDESTDGLNM